jgi:hypothetical protein
MQSTSKSITATISSERPIPFPVFSQLHDRTEPVTQLELELFLSLRNRLKQLEAQVATEEAGLRSRLEAGASVDPVVRVVELKESFRRNVSWKDVVIRLATRLKMDGAGYCARVLAGTKPTRTVSLVVE